MIDWDSPDWGGRVHYAENGSWVGDKHDKDKNRKKAKKKAGHETAPGPEQEPTGRMA